MFCTYLYIEFVCFEEAAGMAHHFAPEHAGYHGGPKALAGGYQ